MPTSRSTPRGGESAPPGGDGTNTPGGSGSTSPGGGDGADVLRGGSEAAARERAASSGAVPHGGEDRTARKRAASSGPAAGAASAAPATLQRVADEAGVSLATASRVLNGSARTVNPQLSEHVRAVAARLRYVSNGPAQALARSTTSLVGLLVHDINDPYFSAIAAGAMRVARQNDLLVMVSSTHREPVLEADYIARLAAQRARAIVLAGSPSTDPATAAALSEQLRLYIAGGGRVVAIGDQGPGVDSIHPDNSDGGWAAAMHLTGLGHERIGVIAGPPGLVTVADRLEGFRRGLLEGGDTFGSAPVIEGDFTREGGYHAMQRLLETRPDLTAVFALSDLMAVGALKALREAGLRVPEDVSLVGFDDIAPSTDVTPELTTIGLDLEGMGELAMRMVVADRLGIGSDGGGNSSSTGQNDDKSSARQVVRVPATLIERASTGPAAR